KNFSPPSLNCPPRSLIASHGGSRSSWPSSGIGKSRPTSWPGAWTPPVGGPTRKPRPAAARHSPREPLCHTGFLVPLSPLAAGDPGVGGPLLRDASGRPAPSVFAAQEGRGLLVGSCWSTHPCAELIRWSARGEPCDFTHNVYPPRPPGTIFNSVSVPRSRTKRSPIRTK